MERRDPDTATTIYQRLANKGGPWAPNALYAAGRLASERGNRTEATRLLAAVPRALSERRERR